MGRAIYEALQNVTISEKQRERILHICCKYDIRKLSFKEQKTDRKGNIYPNRLEGISLKDNKIRSFDIGCKLPKQPVLCGICYSESDIIISIYAGLAINQYEKLKSNTIIGYAWKSKEGYYKPIRKKDVSDIVVVG